MLQNQVVDMRRDGCKVRALGTTHSPGRPARARRRAPTRRPIPIENKRRRLRMTTSASRCGALLAGLPAANGTAPAGAAFPGANRKIAFSSDRAGDNEIFAMNPDGTEVEQLTFNNGSDYDPAWSADGGRIAFTGYEDGDAEIYVRS